MPLKRYLLCSGGKILREVCICSCITEVGFRCRELKLALWSLGVSINRQ